MSDQQTPHQTSMTTCPDCAGTGGGHPDNIGYRCNRCGGSGGIPEQRTTHDLAREWMRAGFRHDEAWRRAEMGVSPDGR